MKRIRQAKAIVVQQAFDVSTLPPQLDGMELYWLAGPNIVVIEGKRGSAPVVLLKREGGRFVCDCGREEIDGMCNHTRALGRGLWSRLIELSHHRALLTFTDDWCVEAVELPQTYHPAILSEIPVSEPAVR